MCDTAHLLIVVAKSDCTRDHAYYLPRFTRGQDPESDFATNITLCAILQQEARQRYGMHAIRKATYAGRYQYTAGTTRWAERGGRT